ncbi:MAG: glycosyl hydrolase [Lacisediminihabitans sp.]
MTTNATEPEDAFVGHPGKNRRRRPTVMVPLIVMLLVGATVGVATTQVQSSAAGTATPSPSSTTQCLVAERAALVPKKGVLFGVNLDWNTETLPEYAKSLGHAPAVTVQFSDIPYSAATWRHTLDAVTQVKANGGTLLLTLEPHGGFDTMSDVVIAKLVADLAAINDQGVPVVVRFAHEMNGSWYAWGQQPTKYVETFRRVATAVHAGAPGTSMMWAPNYGGGYPFNGGQFAVQPGTADFALLDTNHDGSLTMADDTYAPYFPGDRFVDWVGISLYHWGNQRPWGDNEVPEPTKFADMLTGTYNGTAGDDSAIPDFYEVYGVDHGHPVAIPETSAIYTPTRAGGATELAVKQAWWSQAFSAATHEEFPQLKMINWFEWNKFEIEIDDNVDWRASGTPQIAKAFAKDLPSWFRYGDDVSVCQKATNDD